MSYSHYVFSMSSVFFLGEIYNKLYKFIYNKIRFWPVILHKETNLFQNITKIKKTKTTAVKKKTKTSVIVSLYWKTLGQEH